MAVVANGACGVIRKTGPALGHAGPAWADVGSAVIAKQDGYAGGDEHYEHIVRGGLDARISEVGAVGRTAAAGLVGHYPMGAMDTMI